MEQTQSTENVWIFFIRVFFVFFFVISWGSRLWCGGDEWYFCLPMICTDGHVRMIYRLWFLFCVAIFIIFLFCFDFVFIRGFGYTWNMEQTFCMCVYVGDGIDDVYFIILVWCLWCFSSKFFFYYYCFVVGHIVCYRQIRCYLEFVSSEWMFLIDVANDDASNMQFFRDTIKKRPSARTHTNIYIFKI